MGFSTGQGQSAPLVWPTLWMVDAPGIPTLIPAARDEYLRTLGDHPRGHDHAALQFPR